MDVCVFCITVRITVTVHPCNEREGTLTGSLWWGTTDVNGGLISFATIIVGNKDRVCCV